MMDREDAGLEPNEVGHMSGRKPAPNFSRRAARFGRWSVAVFLRLLFWYTIATAVFRCPANPAELDGLSPRVCQPYLAARSYIDPFVSPYYEAYADPYVQTVRPYAQNFNKNIYVPTKSFASRTYRNYGAPRFEQGSRFLQARWEMTVTPRLHSARDSLIRAYDVAVRPYIRKTKAIVVPRYQAVTSFVTRLHQNHVSPYYSKLERGVVRAYGATYNVFARHVSPWSQKLWSILATLVNDTLRPRVSGLYAENIEPQLVRIGQKLASYREEKEVHRVTDEVEDPANATTASTSSEPSTSTSVDVPTGEPSASNASATSSLAASQSEKARPQVAADLKNWQERFAVAADKGCEDLEEQVASIVQTWMDAESKKKGEELLVALEEVAQKELEELKTKIRDTVQSAPEGPGSEAVDAAREHLLQLLRTTGMTVREPAHALRQWHDGYDAELVSQVSAAVSSTLEVLDGIRDLGLQEIGMRWAWTDGVTYKDWAKYHALKQQFSDWRSEVNGVGMRHQALVDARAAGNEILARGMEIAESTAKELARLKDVGKWKVEAGDASDNFETPTTDPTEFRAMKRAMDVEDAESSSGAPEGTTAAGEEPTETEDADSEPSAGANEVQEETHGHAQREVWDSEDDNGSTHRSENSQSLDQDEFLSTAQDTPSSSAEHETEDPGDQPKSAAFSAWFDYSDTGEAFPDDGSSTPRERAEPDFIQAHEADHETAIPDDDAKWQFENVRERFQSLSEEAMAHVSPLSTESSTSATEEDTSSSTTSPTDTVRGEL